jgi:predicted DNA-binding ribbon-helix-helix protein
MEITKVPTPPTNDELTVYQLSRSTRMRVVKSSNVKRSIVIDGHSTSVAPDDAFWNGLKKIAQAKLFFLAPRGSRLKRT